MPSLPYPTPSGISTFIDLFRYVNVVSDGLFGLIVVGLVWVIAWVAFGSYPREEALSGASFIGFVTSVLLWAAGIAGTTPLLIMSALLFGSAGLLFLRR